MSPLEVTFWEQAILGISSAAVCAVGLWIWASIAIRRETRRREAYYRAHGMGPAPLPQLAGAWLSPEPLRGYLLHLAGGSPRMGDLSDARSLTCDGRQAVSFVEAFRDGENGEDTFYDVSVPTRWPGYAFAVRNTVKGDAPPELGDAMAKRTFLDARAVIVHQGQVIVRGRQLEDIETNARWAVWLAGALESVVAPPLR